MTNLPSNLRLGTRGSLLARAQSGIVADELMRLHEGLRVELIIISTTGDRIVDRPLHDIGGKGLFTRELEQALLAGQIDFAVHSLKDVPTTMPLVSQENLVLAAIPRREDPADVLVNGSGPTTLEQLPKESRVGTGSLRRRCQILQIRPDLMVFPVRGNIDTRLRKLREGQCDAVVLALAGLKRGGLFDCQEMMAIPTEVMLPAAGQGALALQCRRDDAGTIALLRPLHDPLTSQCVDSERAIVAGLQGDCYSPIAALAIVRQGQLWLRAAVGARGGSPPVIYAEATAPENESASAVASVLATLQASGAVELLASV